MVYVLLTLMSAGMCVNVFKTDMLFNVYQGFNFALLMVDDASQRVKTSLILYRFASVGYLMIMHGITHQYGNILYGFLF